MVYEIPEIGHFIQNLGFQWTLARQQSAFLNLLSSPEASGEEHDHSKQFQPSCNPQDGEIDLQKGMIQFEAIDRMSVDHSRSRVGQHGDGSGQTGLHVLPLNSQKHGRQKQQSGIGKEKDGNVGDHRSRHRIASQLDSNDGAGVEPAGKSAGHKFEHDQNPDDLNGSCC